MYPNCQSSLGRRRWLLFYCPFWALVLCGRLKSLEVKPSKKNQVRADQKLKRPDPVNLELDNEAKGKRAWQDSESNPKVFVRFH